MELVEG
jgi:hypothetical protein